MKLCNTHILPFIIHLFETWLIFDFGRRNAFFFLHFVKVCRCYAKILHHCYSPRKSLRKFGGCASNMASRIMLICPIAQNFWSLVFRDAAFIILFASLSFSLAQHTGVYECVRIILTGVCYIRSLRLNYRAVDDFEINGPRPDSVVEGMRRGCFFFNFFPPLPSVLFLFFIYLFSSSFSSAFSSLLGKCRKEDDGLYRGLRGYPVVNKKNEEKK